MNRVNLGDLKSTTTLAGATVVEGAQATHAVVNESRVDILYMLPPQFDEDGVIHSLEDRLSNRFIRVKVWSKVRPGLFSFSDFACHGKSQAEMVHTMEFAAPALGERQEVLYGDKHELSVLSRKAREHFLELVAHLAREG